MPLYSYQKRAISLLRQGHSMMLCVKPGGGKTRCISKWFKLTKDLHAIVIAPSLVIYDAWTEELDEEHIEFGHGHGTTFEAACEAFLSNELAVLLTTPEMFTKLEGKRKVLRACRQLVIDESTKYKNADSKRFHAIRRIIKRYWKIKQIVAMTGTLMPKDYLQLFSQLWLVGQTEVFNTDSFPEYRDTYFYTKPFKQHEYVIFPGFQEKIEKRIAPWILQPREDEYADMPPIIETVHEVQVSKKIIQLHEAMRKDRTITVDGEDILAANQGVALFKQLQICSGGIYRYTDPDDPSQGREWIHLHDEKRNWVEHIYEGSGSNVLIMYVYKSTFEVLKKVFPGIRNLKSASAVADWKAGKLPYAAGHPASMGHGLNLQDGGNVMIWYDQTPDAEIWWQSIKRLHRGDIQDPVFVHYLTADFKNSKDMYVLDMLYRKYDNQEGLYRRLRKLETN